MIEDSSEQDRQANEFSGDPDHANVEIAKKRRKRLACKGSFKGSTSKYLKTGGQPMPGITDFPSRIDIFKNTVMCGSFCAGNKHVHLLKPMGKAVCHMGYVKPNSGGSHYLREEEALFLIETGKLLVYQNEANGDGEFSGPQISSVQEAYCTFLSDDVQMSHYIVYAHLARSGYKVLIRALNEGDSVHRYYDAHLPQSSFSRTNPPPPAFRVIKVIRWDEEFLSIGEILKFREVAQRDLDAQNVALKLAVVAPDGDVSFYSTNCPQ